MNQLTLLVVVLVAFCYFGGKYCPSALKKNKEMLLGVAGGLVLCSFFGLRLEGFRAWSPTQGAMRDYSADANGSALFHCEMDMHRGRPPAEVEARVQLCEGCRDSGCADRSKCSLDSDCGSNYCQDNLCVPNTAIHKVRQGLGSGSPPPPPPTPPPPSAQELAAKAAGELSSARLVDEMAVGLCHLPDFKDLACTLEGQGNDAVWAGAGCPGDPCKP
tara:strand:- start:40 stop:690 length:651 start_codon:yes stop_codon:yes gene_type:complete